MWFLILITSFLSVVANNNQKPCDAIGRTAVNLSHVAVVFVDLESISTAKESNYSIRMPFSSQFAGVMESFFRCYGASGGLEVFGLKIEKTGNETRECQYQTEDSDFQKISTISQQSVELIFSMEAVFSCGIAEIRRQVVRLLPKVSNLITTVSSLCEPLTCIYPTNLSLFNEINLEIFEVSSESMLYEKLERRVDFLTRETLAEDGNLTAKYTYLSSVPLVSTAIWPSIAAVFLVIAFFFIGLLMCCCSLLFYALIDEDFRRRNEEREWIAANLRRQEFDNVIIPASDLPILNHNDIVPAVKTETTQASEETTLETARSRNLETDKTQDASETVRSCAAS